MYRIGDLVISKSGRDQGRNFMVVEVIDENYVNIADGSLRKLEKPKKKKIKHLEYFGEADERILSKISESKKITNSDLRKMLKGDSEGIKK